MQHLLLCADWEGVVYRLNEKLVNVGVIDEAELPISDSLRTQLRDFHRWHFELCHSGEGAPTPMDERLYDERGVVLWEQLSKELGAGYRVLFPSHEFGREFESPEELRAAQKRESYA